MRGVIVSFQVGLLWYQFRIRSMVTILGCHAYPGGGCNDGSGRLPEMKGHFNRTSGTENLA